MKRFIWKFRYALWIRGQCRLSFLFCWGMADDAFRDFGAEHPIEAAMGEVSYWSSP